MTSFSEIFSQVENAMENNYRMRGRHVGDHEVILSGDENGSKKLRGNRALGLMVFGIMTLALTGCMRVGDEYVTKEGLHAVTDWNSPTLIKPYCEIPEGETVVLTDTSSVYMGSNLSMPVVRLDSGDCDGWVTRDGLRSKLKKTN